ncbi:wiskott-Aldrich syndrome protein family member 1-like [Schistocerca piceifrons]|uniref:wiskott-Aldrich syndrome protein family member 1-like n=1 Tax=Schistocerca piceifrons TaxID=274613 RepID=UPI001F5EEE57|nr:wiskott-Aldrich syndrome protein family member 1-like [Schistocerca piceifrons]
MARDSAPPLTAAAARSRERNRFLQRSARASFQARHPKPHSASPATRHQFTSARPLLVTSAVSSAGAPACSPRALAPFDCGRCHCLCRCARPPRVTRAVIRGPAAAEGRGVCRAEAALGGEHVAGPRVAPRGRRPPPPPPPPPPRYHRSAKATCRDSPTLAAPPKAAHPTPANPTAPPTLAYGALLSRRRAQFLTVREHCTT